MPAKTGASHAIAAFVSIILGSVLSNFLTAHASFLTDISRTTGDTLTSFVGISLPASVTGFLLVSTALAFVWGVAYHFARHGSSRDQNGPNHYVADNPSRSQMAETRSTARGGGVEVPQAVTDLVTGRYRESSEIRAADERVLDHLETVLADSVSVLEDRHDRYVAEGARAGAERVSTLRDSLQRLSQDLARQNPASSEAGAESRFEAVEPGRLASIHGDLVEAAEDLETMVRDFPVAPDDSTLLDERVEPCQRLVDQLRAGLDERANLLAEASDTK